LYPQLFITLFSFYSLIYLFTPITKDNFVNQLIISLSYIKLITFPNTCEIVKTSYYLRRRGYKIHLQTRKSRGHKWRKKVRKVKFELIFKIKKMKIVFLILILVNKWVLSCLSFRSRLKIMNGVFVWNFNFN